MTAEWTIHQRIADRTATVSVVGLGYVGLPLAAAFAEAGFRVHGIEVDPERLRTIAAGQSYLRDVPSETVGRLALDERKLTATDDYDVVADSDAAIICVPTPLSKTRTPDVSHIADATESIAVRLHEDMLVVLESTSYPGFDGGPRTGPPHVQRFTGAGGRQGLLPGLLPRARRPWTAQVDHCEYAKGDRRSDAGMHRGRLAALRSHSGERSPGIVPQDG